MRTTQVLAYSDPDVVALPGTSDALTARTIDATVHPVAQARDAVAEVPRLVDSIPPHLVGGALGLTGVILMLSLQRYRLSMSPVLLAGLLMIEMVVPEDWDREDVSRYLRRNSERLRREISGEPCG